MGEFIAEVDLLRKKAASTMEMGAGFPDQFGSILRMRAAGPPRQEKSPVIASGHRSLKFGEAAASMRSLSGSRGGSGRQDVLIT